MTYDSSQSVIIHNKAQAQIYIFALNSHVTVQTRYEVE